MDWPGQQTRIREADKEARTSFHMRGGSGLVQLATVEKFRVCCRGRFDRT